MTRREAALRSTDGRDRLLAELSGDVAPTSPDSVETKVVVLLPQADSTAAPPSEALLDFAFTALDNGMSSVIPGGGPLAPFCIVDTAGRRALDRFTGDLEEGQARARAKLSTTTGSSFVAVAWDGYLTREGERLDAVFVEASEAGDPKSVILAQQYKSSGKLRKRYAAHGNPVLLRRGESLTSD